MKKVFVGGTPPRKQSGKGFYIALCLCIGLLVYAIWYSEVESDKTQKTTSKQEQTSVVITPRPIILSPAPPAKPTAAPAVTSTPLDRPANAEIVQQTNQSTENAVETFSIKFPLREGHITQVHSMEAPVYSRTFEDWRVHKGIDVSAAAGTQVLAVVDGIIDDVYTDPMMGIVITLKYKEYTFLYANLSTDVLVKKGKAVKAGQAISGVGSSASAESGQEPHLHFEMYQSSVPVDPGKYIE